MCHRDEVGQKRAFLQQKVGSSYLLQTSALGADKGDAVAVVDVGGHGGHAVASLSVQSVTCDQLGTAERLVDVQAAEGVVDRYRLEEEEEKEGKMKEQTFFFS